MHLNWPRTGVVSPSVSNPGIAGSGPGWKRNLSALLPAALALAGIAICTWVAFRLNQTPAFPGCLYLVFVVLAACYGGFWQATVVSVVAASCLDYFFVPPIFSFDMSPENCVALIGFELTSLIISRLSSSAQAVAKEAIAGRRDMERLYEASRRILLLNRWCEPGGPIAALIRETFELQTVTLFDAVPAATFQCGQPSADAEQRTQDAYRIGVNSFDAKSNSWYCVVRVGTQSVGALGLTGAAMTSQAATALCSLTGTALERARAAARESRAAAALQTEESRAAVLDALAHEFKTPLTVVRTASSGLLTVGGLSELQAELLTVIDRQAATLDHLTQHLLKTARLDAAHFTPRLETLLFSEFLRDAIAKLENDRDRKRFRVAFPQREAAILADRQQILSALAQLLDNALRYSEPGSPVDIFLAPEEARTVLTLRSKGPVLSPQDCEHIFERFYRAPETQHVSAGTGLGLSIVKKIVSAHHGSAWAAPEAGYGTSFSISLPAAERGVGQGL
jgi:two-component system, OmpR family, sensor histidine kinase KdpD